MLNRSEILTAAWKGYRDQCDGTGLPFNRKLFGRHLASAWRAAKGRVFLEALVAAEPRMTPRVATIRNELRVMELSDGPTNWDRHRELSVELFRLSVGNAAEAPTRHA